MKSVEDDPSLYAVPHKLEIKNAPATVPVPKYFLNPHFGQERGRGHSIILLGESTFLALEERVKATFKHAFDFT